jgi:hypothetical protein
MCDTIFDALFSIDDEESSQRDIENIVVTTPMEKRNLKQHISDFFDNLYSRVYSIYETITGKEDEEADGW